MPATGERQVPTDSRLVGWKAIAAHLGVSQRTAIRWAETYHLPVTRIPRGDRPIVLSTADELDSWWRSPAATLVRREERPAQEVPGESVEAALDASSVEHRDTSDTALRAATWRRRWVRALALSLSLGFTVLAGCYAMGVLWSPISDQTLARRTRDGAHGEAISRRRLRLTLTIAGKPSAVVVSEGEMARLETPASRLGLQGRVTNESLRLFLFRLAKAGSGESATFMEARNLVAGGVDHVKVDGRPVQLSWEVLDGAGNADREAPKEPCCMICNGVALCGERVAGECGKCDAGAEPGR